MYPNSHVNQTQALFSSRIKIPATQYVGEEGRLFYHEDTGELRLSDGVTPGGWPIFGGNVSGNVTVTLVGDVSGSGSTIGSIPTTLATVNADVGTFGDSGVVPRITVDAKGRITSAANIGIPNTITITGDATGVGTTSSNTAITLNSVNVDIGTFGSNIAIPIVTVNDKGLVTAISTTAFSAEPVLKLYAENGTPTNSPSATGQGTIALGDGAVAQIWGSIARSSGVFVNPGDSQVVDYVSRTITVGGGFEEVFLNGGSTRLILPNNCSILFRVSITARAPAFNQVGMFEVLGGIAKGTTALSTRIVGNASKTRVGTDVKAWDVLVEADSVVGALRVSVRGEAGKAVYWVIHIQTVELII